MKVVQTVGCSTFTRGAKPATRRVADGERMNPQGRARRAITEDREGWRVRANTEETSSTRATSTWRTVHAGARAPVPPVYGSGRPAFTPYRPTRTRQDLPCTSAGEPRTPWLACH